MSFLRRSSVVLPLLLGVALFAGACQGKQSFQGEVSSPEKNPLSHMPDSVSLVVSVDTKKMIDGAFGAHVTNDLLTNVKQGGLPKSVWGDIKIDDFRRTVVGVELPREGLSPTAMASGAVSFVVATEKVFELDALMTRFQDALMNTPDEFGEAEYEVEETEVGGRRAYKVDLSTTTQGPGGRDIAVDVTSFYTESGNFMLVASSRELLEDALAAGAGSGSSMAARADFKTALQSVDQGADFWVAVPPMSVPGAAGEKFSVAGYLSTAKGVQGQFVVGLPSAAQAKDAAREFNDGKGQATQQLAQMAPGIGQAIDKLQVFASGSDLVVKMDLPSALIEDITREVKMLAQMFGGGMMGGF